MAVAVLGCSGDDDDGAEAERTTTTAGVAVVAEPGETESVAIYAVEAPETEEREAFIDAAALHVFEGPASCWQDLPERLGVSADAQVLGVVAPTDGELGDITTGLPGAPMLTGRFVRTCPSGA